MSDGRRAGRAGAGLYDNGVFASGHRRAEGGDLRAAAPHDGPHGADGAVLPGGPPGPARDVPDEHGDRHAQDERPERRDQEARPQSGAPVRIRCYRHEGIVLTNHQRSRGLARLAATWELTRADGRTLTGPAELPDLRPGESAAVPLPFALPEGGGEMWLTLRVVTAVAEPWAPRGTQVCAPRLRLRRAVPAPAGPAPAAAPVAVDGEGLLLHPLLASAPVLSVRRAAPTDDDGPGGVTGAGHEWGLDALVRKVVSVRRSGAAVTVVAEYAGSGGVVRHRQEFTPVEDGVRVVEWAELPAGFADVARVGSVFETVPGLDLPEGAGDAVRRFMAAAPGAMGLAVELGEPEHVLVTRRRDEPVPRPRCLVLVDAGRRAPDSRPYDSRPLPGHLFPPVIRRWSWTLRALRPS
ncbi:hypothetical protein AQI95_22590 [Streptomyces yokosukanensis]|uniref:Beta-galactosidase domain-containing protein n=1 Tax=Streptomyces yokosukanensis TaxID=67386 RepID=A0A101P1Q3_9ACTN|nr:hypothetical protein AQI95_22590 [Streptomyces yokosukanensis]